MMVTPLVYSESLDSLRFLAGGLNVHSSGNNQH